jgi:hypothetical protein
VSEEPKPDVTKRTIEVSSVKLSKDLITDLVEIVDEHYQDCKTLDKYATVTYNYEYTTGRKKSKIETHNRDNFLSYDIVRTDLLKIQLHLDSKSPRIWVLIIAKPGTIHIEVSGINFTQVNGITSRIEEILDSPKAKTFNWFFHSKRAYLYCISQLV